MEEKLPIDVAVPLQLGRKVSVSAYGSDANPFLGWDAQGTLIHGSFDASAEFVHVNSGQLMKPLHYPISGVTVLAMADDFTYSGAVTGVETTLGGNWTHLKGNYGDVVTLTNPHGGGWEEAMGDDFTLQNTISVTFGKLKNALRPMYCGAASTTLKHNATTGGGGQVAVSVSDDGDDPYSPYPNAASSPRYAATSWVPHYAFFGGTPNPGWTLYDWHSSATKKPFELDPLYIFRDTAVAATAEFVPLAKLTWEVSVKGDSGGSDSSACMGFCVATPALAYYGGSTYVRVKAVGHGKYRFSHWEGSGVAWDASGIEDPVEDCSASNAVEIQGASWELGSSIYVKMGNDDGKPEDRHLTAVMHNMQWKGDPAVGHDPTFTQY